MNQRVVFGFSLTVLILVVIGWVSYQSILEFRSTAQVVSRSNHMADLRENLLTDVVSAESETRGYVITRRSEYLNLYKEALGEVQNGMNKLRASRDLSISPQLVDRLLELIELRMERLRLTLEERDKTNLEALDGVLGPGKKLMDEIRTISGTLETEERKRLEHLDLRLKMISARSTWIIGAGSVCAVLFHLMSTVALSRAISNRERLERSLLEISEREQRRIGQDLHDGLCQQLTGISLMISSFQRNLSPDAEAEQRQIVRLINGCIEEARLVTRGLHPVPNEPAGLVVGLRELVDKVHSETAISCELLITGEVYIVDVAISSNLYRIAQEAVRNAIKHSGAKTIRVHLLMSVGNINLTIEDDGSGFLLDSSRRGLGLEIMRYRATSIGGGLSVKCNQPTGTLVDIRVANPVTQ